MVSLPTRSSKKGYAKLVLRFIVWYVAFGFTISAFASYAAFRKGGMAGLTKMRKYQPLIGIASAVGAAWMTAVR